MSKASSDTSSFVDENWISWFCSLAGNQFFCEIDKGYIDDAFNLFGLKQHFPKDYNKALDTILDRIGPAEAESEELSRSAALLFGLIHARYIVTSHGLEVMHRKFVLREFGECPRTFCRGQAALPMGFTDEPRHGAVKLFCPRCQDIYNCQSSQRHIDGSFFGPTFPNLFMMSFDELVPEPPIDRYIPRIFGFKIHPSSRSIPIAKSRVHRGMSLSGAPPGHIQIPMSVLGTMGAAAAAAGMGMWSVETDMACARRRGTADFLQPHALYGPPQTFHPGTAESSQTIATLPYVHPSTTAAAAAASAMGPTLISPGTGAGAGRRSGIMLARQQAEQRYRERLSHPQHLNPNILIPPTQDDDDSRGIDNAQTGLLNKKRLLPLTIEQIAQHNNTIQMQQTETTETGTETGTDPLLLPLSAVVLRELGQRMVGQDPQPVDSQPLQKRYKAE